MLGAHGPSVLLDGLIPTPRLLEVDSADLAAPPELVWELVRHGELAQSPLIRALFALRSLPERLRGKHENPSVRIDDLESSPERPGFQVLADDPPHEFVVGAIGKVWQVEIPFVHVPGAAGFSAFDAVGFVKVAWAIRVVPRGEQDSRIELEVRVNATDDDSWRKFERYFRLIGPGSHFIRRSLLASLERSLGTPEARENERTLPPTGRLHLAAIRPVHHFMQRAMLRHLAVRVEGRLPRDDFHDVVEGLGGMAVITAAFLSPFLRDARSHWGLSQATAARAYPGDDLVREPRWSWTHGIEIAAPAESVWPWIAQLGADRSGFYSYQWLENLAGCNLRNAEVVHPEWEAHLGGSLVLHPDPKAPRLQIVALDPGKYLVAHARPDNGARALGKPWIGASWLFFIEPLGEKRCRLVSRYRVEYSDDLATRLAVGPTLIEPVGFAMDRRMLLGVKKLVERATHRQVLATPAAF